MPKRHDEPEPQLSDQPPHHPHAEKAVLTLMLRHSTAACAQIVATLVAADFYAAVHRVIFETVIEMYKAQRPVGHESVDYELTARADTGSTQQKTVYAYARNDVADLIQRAAAVDYKLTDLQGYAHQVKDASVRRDMQRLGREMQTMAADPTKTASLIAASISDELHRKLATAESGLVSLDKIMRPVSLEVEQRARATDHFRGIRTGYPTLDAILQGYQPEQYYLFGAYSSVGKTALALNTMRAALDAHNDLQIIYYSLEMSQFALGTRLLAIETGIDLGLIRSGYLTDDQFEDVARATSIIGGYRRRMYVNTRRVSVDNIAMECRALATAQDDKVRRRMVVVDYIQLVSAGENEQRLKEYQILRHIGRTFVDLSKELACPVIVFAQLNGDEMERPPDFRPWRKDLRDSKALADDARAVILMSRPWVHRKRDENYRECFVRLIIDKHSEGDASEDVDLHFRGRQQIIREEECTAECPTHMEGPPFPVKAMRRKTKKSASEVQKALHMEGFGGD